MGEKMRGEVMIEREERRNEKLIYYTRVLRHWYVHNTSPMGESSANTDGNFLWGMSSFVLLFVVLLFCCFVVLFLFFMF